MLIIITTLISYYCHFTQNMACGTSFSLLRSTALMVVFTSSQQIWRRQLFKWFEVVLRAEEWRHGEVRDVIVEKRNHCHLVQSVTQCTVAILSLKMFSNPIPSSPSKAEIKEMYLLTLNAHNLPASQFSLLLFIWWLICQWKALKASVLWWMSECYQLEWHTARGCDYRR